MFLIDLQGLYAGVDTKYSLRKCMLLPLLGQARDVGLFKVYKRVETYLKRSNWCHYRSNSNALTILQSYQPNLDYHLEKEEVLGMIASETRAGSLIRIKMSSVIDGVSLSMKVIGDNGKDIFFSEKVRLQNNSIDLIFKTIINWLDFYKKTIPYDGRIIGVLDKQFTIDVGSAHEIFRGGSLQVLRPMEKKNHPLLNEIVGWKTEAHGKGKVMSVSEFQSLAEMTEYLPGHLPRSGDWVVMERKSNSGDMKKITKHTKSKKYAPGQFGTLSVGTKVGGGSDAIRISNDFRKMEGFIFGLHFNGELWITRDYWASLGLERNVGTYDNEFKETFIKLPEVTQDIVKFKLGHRYLPLGFFWGPRIDLYLGYGMYSYDLEASPKDGFGHHKIKGPLFGVKGDFPFHKLFRGFVKLDFLFLSSYEEEAYIFGGGVESRTSYQMELGGHYNYSSWASLDGAFEVTSNEVKFSGNRGFNFKETAFKVGITLIY